MVVGLYLATFLASLAVLALLLIKHKRVITCAVLFSILVTVNSCGRYLVAVSTTYELARLGNLFIHVGGCYCPLLVVFILANLSNVRLPWWVSSGLTMLSTGVFALSLTTGHSEIYYKEFYAVIGQDYTYLVKSYGPAHILYMAMVFSCLLAMLYCLVCVVRKPKEVPLTAIVAVVVTYVVIQGASFVQRMTDSHVSYTSLGYLIAIIVFTKFIDAINMYDLPTNIANCIEKRDENGYIEFDAKYCCVGYNERIRKLFPEVAEKWCVGKPVPVDDSFLYQEVISWMFARNPAEKKTICVHDRYFEMFVHEIPYGRKACVGYMLEMIDRTAENKYMAAIKHYNDDLEEEVRKKTQRISEIRDMMVVGMANMVGSRDDSTGGHIKRTSQVMKVFARHLLPHQEELGLNENFLDMVTRAAPMHDLGKITVDDSILRKAGPLTREEFEKMKEHATEGAHIVREILAGAEDDAFVAIAENVAHYHHERWDGTGYPAGLKGTEIPIEARLLSLIDVLDALVSKRSYKEPMPWNQAFMCIESGLGTQFDPDLGRLFLECGPKLMELYDKWNHEVKPEFNGRSCVS